MFVSSPEPNSFSRANCSSTAHCAAEQQWSTNGVYTEWLWLKTVYFVPSCYSCKITTHYWSNFKVTSECFWTQHIQQFNFSCCFPPVAAACFFVAPLPNWGRRTIIIKRRMFGLVLRWDDTSWVAKVGNSVVPPDRSVTLNCVPLTWSCTQPYP